MTIPEALWRSLDILTPNRLEAARLAGCAEHDDPAAIVRQLILRHGCAVVMTLGATGALVAETSGTMSVVAPPPIDPSDTTGAGDAFNGVFATRLAETGDMAEAARWGVIAGALACTGPGVVAALPTRAAIEARLGEVAAERLA